MTGESIEAKVETDVLPLIHTDVGFANEYRIELIKITMTLATALLAFTVTFRPTLIEPRSDWLIWIGWLALGSSTLGAMVNMYGWERIYISYRDLRRTADRGEGVREGITTWRRVGMFAQFFGFGVGVLCIAVFSALNLDNVRVPA